MTFPAGIFDPVPARPCPNCGEANELSRSTCHACHADLQSVKLSQAPPDRPSSEQVDALRAEARWLRTMAAPSNYGDHIAAVIAEAADALDASERARHEDGLTLAVLRSELRTMLENQRAANERWRKAQQAQQEAEQTIAQLMAQLRDGERERQEAERAGDCPSSTSAQAIAEEWLRRQVATEHDDLLDEGDCRTCGHPAGEGHEPTDPCGIVAGLLDALHVSERQRGELQRSWDAVLVQARGRTREVRTLTAKLDAAECIITSLRCQRDPATPVAQLAERGHLTRRVLGNARMRRRARREGRREAFLLTQLAAAEQARASIETQAHVVYRVSLDEIATLTLQLAEARASLIDQVLAILEERALWTVRVGPALGPQMRDERALILSDIRAQVAALRPQPPEGAA